MSTQSKLNDKAFLSVGFLQSSTFAPKYSCFFSNFDQFSVFSWTRLINATDSNSLRRRNSRIDWKLFIHSMYFKISFSLNISLEDFRSPISTKWNFLSSELGTRSRATDLPIFFFKLCLFVYLAYVMKFICAVKTFIAWVTTAQIFISKCFRNFGFILC